MIKNEVSVTITDTMVNDTISKLNDARKALASVLIMSLSPEQRKARLKMSKGSLQYVQENYNFAQSPDLKAQEIILTEWNKDITACSQMLKIMNVLEPLYTDANDMLKIIGSEAMDAAQHNYRFLRYKAGEGVPSAQSAYEKLRSLRWEKPTRKASNTPPPAKP